MEICSSTILDFTRALHVSTGISYYYGPLEGATQDIGHRTGTGHEYLHFVMLYNVLGHQPRGRPHQDTQRHHGAWWLYSLESERSLSLSSVIAQS